MIRFRVFSPSPCILPVLAAAVAAVSVPLCAHAQTSGQRTEISGKEGPTTVSAEKMTGRPDREVHLERNVEIIRDRTIVNADRATYHIVEDEVEASGNIRMQRKADKYTGDELKLKIETGQGFVTSPSYKLERSNGQGNAKRIDFESNERATVQEGTYSTCEGPDPDWYLKSSTLNLDTGREVGIAKKTIVYFKGIPILGAPAMSFPLSDARKSGLMPPTIGSSNKGGIELTVPYYFNIAPNRDLTLYPKLITRRGLQLGADARYLGETYTGQTKIEVLPSDQQTGTDRYAFSSTHSQTLGPGWSMSWNVTRASDDDYPNDFANSFNSVYGRLLPRDFNINYAGMFWNAGMRVSSYQVLQDPLAPITLPYARLPQLTLQASRQDVKGFDWTVDTELTRFWHPDMVTGDRLVINPQVSFPIVHPSYFVTPKVSLHATTYNLADRVPAGTPSHLTRTLPTFSLDSGLTFERDAKFFGQPGTQTLEPRLFYVYTPYRDQSLFPKFDTSEAQFNLTQIFNTNRFIGNDRISDANQLTAAVVSRYLDPVGAERARVAVGQRFYFSEQRVMLDASLPRNESRSDFLFSAAGQISPTLSAEVNMQYSESLRNLNRDNYALRWQPGPKKVLNLEYRRDIRDELAAIDKLKQFEISGQWPMADRWYAVGRVNYSILDSKIAEGLLGMEYKADCWIFRVVGQRVPTATQKATTSISFQLELSGLSRIGVGTNPLESLRSGVPGYQPVSQPRNTTQ